MERKTIKWIFIINLVIHTLYAIYKEVKKVFPSKQMVEDAYYDVLDDLSYLRMLAIDNPCDKEIAAQYREACFLSDDMYFHIWGHLDEPSYVHCRGCLKVIRSDGDILYCLDCEPLQPLSEEEMNNIPF